MNIDEAIEILENIDRYDAYHLDRNEFTEDDHENIRKVIKWLAIIGERWDKV